ncbi:ceramide kinase [Fundulus diaphanus]
MEDKIIGSELFQEHRKVEVALYPAVLTWKEIEQGRKRSSVTSESGHSHAVQVCEIVAVHKAEDEADAQTRIHPKTIKQHSQQHPYAFTVSYVKRTQQHLWRCSDVTFHCAEQQICEQWIQVANEQLSLLTNRPRSLLVYINPYGGKRRGKRIYEQKVAPVFRRAGIFTDVIVTERANHARDHLKTEANLDDYDGYAGLGDSQPMDVCSVHHNNVFLKYSVSLLGYGFYGDVLTESERNRWLGPARYDLSGFKTFLSHNHYEGTVSFLPAEDNVGHPRDKLQCRSGCRICQHKHSSKEEHNEVSEEEEKPAEGSDIDWSVIHGKFIAINSANMSCACPRSPKGLSPSAHLADGTTDLILVRKCSRLDFFKHLLRHTNKDDQFDHWFVEVHRVRKFRFQPWHHEPVPLEDQSERPEKPDISPTSSLQETYDYNTAESSWNCDGEILHHTAIQVSVQCQLIRLFARGIEEQQDAEAAV